MEDDGDSDWLWDGYIVHYWDPFLLDDRLAVEYFWHPWHQGREIFIEFAHPRPRYEEGEVIRIRSDTLSPALLRSYRRAWLLRDYSIHHLLDHDDVYEQNQSVSA